MNPLECHPSFGGGRDSRLSENFGFNKHHMTAVEEIDIYIANAQLRLHENRRFSRILGA